MFNDMVISQLSVNKVSAVKLREAKGRLSYKRGAAEREMKVKIKSKNRRDRGRSLNLPLPSFCGG
jgi:hypothetical protein